MADEPQVSQDDDYDSPWKEIIERFFPQLLDMFLNEAYDDIDWTRGWESRNYERGYARRDVLELLRALDWMMTLPGELDMEFDRTVTELEANMGRPYVTTWERKGMKLGEARGVRETILLMGEQRLGQAGADIHAALAAISDLERLRNMARRLFEVETWADLLQL